MVLTRIFGAAEIARQAARQAFDRGLGGLVQHQVVQPEMPADRPEVQDHAAARALHRRHHGLGGEELMAEVHRHALVPIFRRDLLDRVAIVVRGIVDQDVDAAKLLFQIGDHALDRRDVGQVAMPVDRDMLRARGQPAEHRLAGIIGDIDEGDFRALRDKCFDQAFADTAATTGDDDALVDKAWIMCAGCASGFCLQHGLSLQNIVRHDAASRPRRARLRIRSPMPNCQGGAALDVVTRLTRRPMRGVEMLTTSPTLWVKPCLGTSRS